MPRTRRLLLTLLLALILFAGCGQPEPPAAPATATLPAAGSSTALPLAPTPESAAGLSPDQVATLSSLVSLDGYPLYTMDYHGPYGRGQATLPDSAPAGSPPTWACSLFAALGDEQNRVYGRNFDWDYSPALLLFTDPPDGYASISMVDIAYLGFEGETAQAVTDLPLAQQASLLNAPFIPFDGMNERGLVVGMAAVPSGDMQPDPARPTIDSVGIIREMLDYAADVNEALAILQGYNIDMGQGPPIHYLLADRSGRALLVEFYRGQVVVIPNEGPWHTATNFLLAATGDQAAGQCSRYDRIVKRLAGTEGRLTVEEAMGLLGEVAAPSTQWSVVYDLGRGQVHVAMGRAYDRVHTLGLDGAGP